MNKLKARLHTYFIDAMGAMAQGLFASLLIGTIIKTIGQYCNLAFFVISASFSLNSFSFMINSYSTCLCVNK